MIKTRFTEEFGVEHPVVMGGMMGVGRAGLVAAVANAGALGFLTALTQPTAEDLLEEVRRTREMTDKPFGINITILPTIRPVAHQEYVQAIVESGVKLVETAGRNPEPFLPAFKEAGIKVIHKCTSVRHSVKAEKIGCDAVSIDGFECAGHPGEDDIPGLVLIPCTANQVSLPLIASGGFGDARGLVAALSLGADAMNMGTRFLATKEADIHENVKRKLVEATERDTALVFRKFHNTARIFKNSVADQVAELESKPDAKFEDVAPLVAGDRGRNVFQEGDLEAGVWSAGMVTGLIHDIPSCDELVRRIVSEAGEIIHKRLDTMAVG
ncbi:MAG: nitronate monooxygenase [Deltaproteobacteria bacterium]|nr:nitronate monooxygenase [Deltaproteobacteria bacterium]